MCLGAERLKLLNFEKAGILAADFLTNFGFDLSGLGAEWVKLLNF